MGFDPGDYLNRFSDRIARHRFVNWTTSVHTRLDLDFTAADAYLRDSGLAGADPPVTREHLWLCAAARVIRERPLFNVAYDGLRELEARDRIHLRTSLIVDGRLAWGVIEDADRLDPAQMARACAALPDRAVGPEVVESAARRRPGRLGRLVDDLTDSLIDLLPMLEGRLGYRAGQEAGTFTVLNAGAFGAEDLHAVVLRPAAAMLVVMKPRQVVEPGPDGPVVRWRVPMAVPFSHNLMDTDAAGYFLYHLQELLDDPGVRLLGEPGGGA